MHTRNLYSLLFILSAIITLNACKGKNTGPKPLCDEKPCIADTIKFTALHPAEPYLLVVPNNCYADTIVWSYKGMGIDRKIHLSTFMGHIVNLGPGTVKGYVIDTAYAVLVFNDCDTRRGYWLRLPFDKGGSMEKSISAFNSIDPRYSVEEGLLCYKSSNTIYVEDIRSRKIEKIIIEEPKLEFETMYDIVDSVLVTRSRFFIQMKDGGKTIPFEKNINLKP